jgi:hypothetical protein
VKFKIERPTQWIPCPVAHDRINKTCNKRLKIVS